MTKKIDFLAKELSVTGAQYYREVLIEGHWKILDHSGNSLLAYSQIDGDEETLVVMNLNSENEIENSITVDKNLTPAGSKMKDRLGVGKNYIVEEFNGRHFVTLKLKPHHVALLRINSK